MGRESYALMAGMFVISLLAAALGAFYWLGGYQVERDTYLIVTRGAVSGLKPESTVFYRGVKAGKVMAVGFDPEDVGNILIRIEVDRDLPITRGTYATLRSQPLTGLSEIELNDAGDHPEPLPTHPDHPARIPMRPSLMDRLTESGEDIMEQIKTLTTNLNALLNDENRGRIEHTLVLLETATERMGVLEKQLDRTLAGLPALTQQARQTLQRVDGLTDEAKDLTVTARGLMTSGKLAADTLATDTLPQVNDLLRDLRPTVRHVDRLVKRLDQDPQMLLLGQPSPMPGPGEPGYGEGR